MSDTSHLEPPVPRMTISMLGAMGSGKSSYLAGMYNDIVRGAYNYTFKADNEIRLRVNEEIRILNSGTPLDPTDEESPKAHNYTLGALRDGTFTVLVEIKLTDFRGGAILYPGKENTDSAQLYEMLAVSDSIFVVLDSAHFIEPVTRSRYEEVAGLTNANHIATLIGGTLVDRQAADRPLPSVAVLLAKSDMLYEQRGTRYGPRRDPEDVHQNVYELLPVAFGLGWKSGFFQVSIGEFTKEDGRNRLTAVQPDGLSGPIFFAVACFLADHQKVLHEKRQLIEAEHQKAVESHDSLERLPPFIRWFRTRKIAEVQAQLDRTSAQLKAYSERSDALARELRVLWQWVRPQ